MKKSNLIYLFLISSLIFAAASVIIFLVLSSVVITVSTLLQKFLIDAELTELKDYIVSLFNDISLLLLLTSFFSFISIIPILFSLFTVRDENKNNFIINNIIQVKGIVFLLAANITGIIVLIKWVSKKIENINDICKGKNVFYKELVCNYISPSLSEVIQIILDTGKKFSIIGFSFLAFSLINYTVALIILFIKLRGEKLRYERISLERNV
ncbi:MAG: hypothetical protein QW350_05370 [Candidatus Aenigmatarchaeota archaeon]